MAITTDVWGDKKNFKMVVGDYFLRNLYEKPFPLHCTKTEVLSIMETPNVIFREGFKVTCYFQNQGSLIIISAYFVYNIIGQYMYYNRRNVRY